MPDYEILTLLISLAAVIIAAVSLYRTNRISVRQIELQEEQHRLTQLQQAKEEEARLKADVRVRLAERGNGPRLVIFNGGPGKARDVVVDVIVNDGELSPVIDSEMDSLFPIPQLLAGEDVSMMLMRTIGTPDRFGAKAIWTDEDGQRRKQFSQISL